MSKTERLIAMMMTINSKRHFTVGELAEEFSVSKRSGLSIIFRSGRRRRISCP